MFKFLKMLVAGKEIRALERYRVACTTAHRWNGQEKNSPETAEWIGEVGEGKRGLDIEKFRERLRASPALRTSNLLLEKLKKNGGCIVSTNDCSTMEIADARVRGDFYVDENGFGFVLRLHTWLQKHSRFASGATDPCESRHE